MSTAQQACERELSLAKARQRIDLEIAALNLTCHSHTYGTKVINQRITLTMPNTRCSAIGSGKGYTDTAQVGARFEALEHYLTQYHSLKSDFDYRHSNSFVRTGFLSDDSVLDFLTRAPAATIACRRYYSPLDQNTFSYPVALSLPHYANAPLPDDTFNYASLRRYCSNSGIAIGATYNEAVLHASNECIERDALSLFLLSHFYYQDRVPIKVLQRPDDLHPLACLWRDVEQELASQVVVLDISTEFCSSTYLAFCKPSRAGVNVFGTGTSLDPEHAASRALTELAQLQLTTDTPEVAQHLSLQSRHLAAFPRLQRCLHMNIQTLMLNATVVTVTLSPAQPGLSVSEQVNTIAQNVRIHGRELGVNVMHQSQLGTTLANVVIPGLERFYIVGSGNVVAPLARGLNHHRYCRSFYG